MRAQLKAGPSAGYSVDPVIPLWSEVLELYYLKRYLGKPVLQMEGELEDSWYHAGVGFQGPEERN